MSPAEGPSRRSFLADVGMGFTGLALGALLFRDGVARAGPGGPWTPPDGRPHFAPRAKRVIWLFMAGGVSHMESFDPKPELNKYAGKTISETPYKTALASPYLKTVRGKTPPALTSRIMPLQVGYRKRGKCGTEVSDWWPHVGGCVDDVAVVRSLWTTNNDHGAQLQFHNGRHWLDGMEPSIGSWVHYGLGSLNENLPQFVVLGNLLGECCGGADAHNACYLGPMHNGVRLSADPKKPLRYASPGPGTFQEEQRGEFGLLGRLNRLTEVEYPDDPALRARIKSYELAFRMQTAVPEVFRLDRETEATRRLYGLDRDTTRPFGELCLAARRLIEQGVRFVQVYHGAGGAGGWDAHAGLRKNHSARCLQVDQPIAGLLKDLKQRGLLDDTLVVWGSEFGRSPATQGADGRDHNCLAFSAWLAGGGIKGGVVHGGTDDLGLHAVERRHYVTDLHATVLHQLGLDPHRLEIPGRKRLEVDHGTPIRDIMA